MTTTPHNADAHEAGPPSAERAWAAEQLGLDASQSTNDARGALLRQIARDDFLPDDNWQALARVATGLHPPAEFSPAEVIQTDYRRVLRGEVERFAKEYFQLAPAQRRARYDDLQRRCAQIPSLLMRVTALEPGLNVGPIEPAGAEAPDALALCHVLVEMFPRRPHERAVVRQRFERRTSRDPQRWSRVAVLIAKLYPDIARLDVDFITGLRDWKAIERRLKVDRRARRKDSERTLAATGGGSSKAWLWVCVWAVLMVGRCAVNESSRPTYHAPSVPRTFSPEVERGLRALHERQPPASNDSPDALPPDHDFGPLVFPEPIPVKPSSRPPSKIPPKYDDLRRLFALPPSDGRSNRVPLSGRPSPQQEAPSPSP